MSDQLYHFIDGVRVGGTSGRQGDIFNPATGEVVRSVPLANAKDVRNAVDSAAAAQPGWGATPPAKRAQVMFMPTRFDSHWISIGHPILS